MKGYARIAAAVSTAAVADINANRESILSLWREASSAGVNVVVFPELSLSGYSIRDLCMNATLLDACENSLSLLIEAGAAFESVAIVGLPVRFNHGLYNVAAVIHQGKLIGVVPKAYLPNYREFEEARWFRSGFDVPAQASINIDKHQAPFGLDLIFDSNLSGLSIGVEICEDTWVQVPPSSFQVSNGASIICNLSASNFTIGKAELRRLLARSMSDRGKCAYVYVAAGPGESSTDVSFDADAFICENGSLLSESKRFARTGQLLVQDIDLELLSNDAQQPPLVIVPVSIKTQQDAYLLIPSSQRASLEIFHAPPSCHATQRLYRIAAGRCSKSRAMLWQHAWPLLANRNWFWVYQVGSIQLMQLLLQQQH